MLSFSKCLVISLITSGSYIVSPPNTQLVICRVSLSLSNDAITEILTNSTEAFLKAVHCVYFPGWLPD